MKSHTVAKAGQDNPSNLDWQMILLMRRKWTSLSFTVTTLCGWVMACANGIDWTSTWWLILAISAALGISVWLRTEYQIRGLARSLSDRSARSKAESLRLAAC